MLISSDPAAAYNQPIDTHRGVRMELDAGGCDVSHGELYEWFVVPSKD